MIVDVDIDLDAWGEVYGWEGDVLSAAAIRLDVRERVIDDAMETLNNAGVLAE